MPFSEILGLVAASLTTGSFLPQAILALRTRNTDGISLAMYALFTTGVALWFVYGILVTSWPVIIANFVTFLLAACILTLKLSNTRKSKAVEKQNEESIDLHSSLVAAE
ncbi:SemiSWEET family sugar transporter [Hirschia litorea]|uniref:SemiSWEET family sugar transporter n=1 Tax=Hirschia litorea TaxID=1199156 RepID=A0ABW2IMG1_9PROT